MPRPGVALLEGDCFELLAALEPASADAIISDPPYGTTSLEWDGPVDWERWWPLVDRASKPEAPVVLFSALPAACALIASNARNYRYDLIWEKSNPTGFLDAGRRPLRAHEQILVFCRKPRAAIYNPQKIFDGLRWHRGGGGQAGHYGRYRTVGRSDDGMRHPRSVLHFPSVGPDLVVHPCQKPLALLEWLVRTYSEPGGLVVDPFAGSGTTALACQNTGRGCVAIEKTREFIEVARRRLEQGVLFEMPTADQACLIDLGGLVDY
ncbi:DNA-methyltransferase [Gloeobacter morelensis]|uniref:DNA-methyltransferase n=1 Tax=Gloeobacter morelensis TaxID=2907343 RepID=UPI001E57A0EB|nr:site-specific DNA-methyltransferase [Gloeobacter morelensis]